MSGRVSEFFRELHTGLPRQGPGDDASTRKALSMLEELPRECRAVDMGCGPGAQTLVLAQELEGAVTAVDVHRPFLQELAERAERAGLSDRIDVVCGDMARPDLPRRSFDLVWSEGAAYVMGFGAALDLWKRLLKPGGYMALSELTWLSEEPPAEIRDYWEEAYPEMAHASDNLKSIRRAGMEPVGHFVLPSEAWWSGYYTPLETNLRTFKARHQEDPEALEAAQAVEEEIEQYRRFSSYYGYVFYLARLPRQ
ncbi:SAM-dependent methyltransferase [Desulfohalovibrio reitneri]|uniref:SAM-dependent methyltransferase n=1 Tax=Desulfohalovibrio reitneri TaxID=1307759 RepID=UPI0004A713F2|nr:class I SAM-dependent methyltransferase [Desulfohalovibrio reitneri]